HQCCARRFIRRRHARLRPTDLSRARRRGWRARRGRGLFERGICRQRAALAAQRLGEHHPRHRQYARSGIRDLRRRRGAGAAVGPLRGSGTAGGGVALLLFYAAGTAVLAWSILSGRNIARLRPTRLRWPPFREILGVGAVAAVTSVQTNVIIALATALVATAAGPAAAGYGTSARLEYLLVPLVFGLGAPLVALVGTNVGAGEPKRAVRIAFVGGALAFAITEAIGVVAALWPQAWITLFSTDARVIETGTDYLRIVGPSYGFFGLALALYFASQGAGRLFWPLTAGFLRMFVAIAGGWLALRLTGSLNCLCAAVARAPALQGLTRVGAIGGGACFRKPPQRITAPAA